VIYLTLPELLHVAERTLGAGYAVRDYGLLEAALARPRATAFGKDAYPHLDAKAAALLHSIARNHALIDGNKRIAFAAAATLQEINGFLLEVDPLDGYEFIHGSLDRHEFRFPEIVDWTRRQTKPLR